MDAWDAGDTGAFVDHFSPGGSWTDPQGRRSSGRDELAAHFTGWRSWEPWSLHWVSNESAPAFTSGTWLWSAASSVDAGSTAAWSGGDLSVTTTVTPAGPRIGELVMTDRYRTPYRDGWLLTPHLEPAHGSVPSPASAANVTLPSWLPAGEATLRPAGTDDRLAALTGEIEVRRLMGDFVHAVDTGLPAAEVARCWADDGRYECIQGDRRLVGEGPEGVCALVETERTETSTHIQALASESIVVEGDRAKGRWRDLWVAETAGEARWISHQYLVEARRHDGVWRLGTVARLRLLDCPYRGGWLSGDSQ
jgi:hypothetical protein